MSRLLLLAGRNNSIQALFRAPGIVPKNTQVLRSFSVANNVKNTKVVTNHSANPSVSKDLPELKLKYTEVTNQIGNTNSDIIQENQTAQDQLDKDMGLRYFMKRTYFTSGLGIAGSLGLASVLDLTGLAMQNPVACIVVGAVTALGSIFAINSGKYEVKKDQYGFLKSENSQGRIAGFTGLCLGMGTMIAPTVTLMSEFVSPMILPAATGITLLTMGGASLFALKCKKDSLLQYGPAFMGGLTGLIGMQLLGLGSYLIVGPNIMFDMIHNVDIYGGIGLFTAMTAYDTQNAIANYKEGKADHLGCATDLYLDFMNLLVRIMEAIAKSKKN